ncbi:MAG: 16S rRNA methyltransferase [Candidatus Helarchaeota archaeon]
MLNIILADSALEPIPSRLLSEPIILKHAKRVGKALGDLILDVSLHHKLLKKLKNSEKRGRPDIIHQCLLLALNSVLNKAGLLSIYVHTINDKIIKIKPEIRMIRNYNRFIGVMEQLFKYGQVPPKGEYLMKIEEISLRGLVSSLKGKERVILTENGKPELLSNIFKRAGMGYSYVIIIGGFPRGNFSQEILKLADKKVKIDPEPLDSVVVLSKVINYYEYAINLDEKRLGL